jgi:cytochrome c
VIALGAIVLYTSEVAIAESPAERHGLRFARLHRAPCHAIDRVGESPLPIAPPFRALRLKYPSCLGSTLSLSKSPISWPISRRSRADVGAQQKREEMKVKPKNLAQPRWPIVTLGMILLCAGEPALAQQAPAAQRGLTFVRVHCAQCHSIDQISDSPLTIAPAFRTLHLKYPIENLQRPLAEGIIAGHPTMPQFRLDPDQIADVIAYLKTLKP